MLYVSDYNFIFYSFRYFEPVEFFENRSDVVMFWGFSNSTGESILNSLEAIEPLDCYNVTMTRLTRFLQ